MPMTDILFGEVILLLESFMVISHEDSDLMSTEDGWSGALALDMAVLCHAIVVILGCCLLGWERLILPCAPSA